MVCICKDGLYVYRWFEIWKDGFESKKIVSNPKRRFYDQKVSKPIKRFQIWKKPSQIWKDGFEYDKNVSNLNKRFQIWKKCLKSLIPKNSKSELMFPKENDFVVNSTPKLKSFSPFQF